MAANFWSSQHCKLLVSPEAFSTKHTKDLQRGLTLLQINQVKAFVIKHIFELSAACKLRQRVSTTAALYFRRFYLRHDLLDHDPRLIAAACVYVASKTEENTVQARTVVYYLKQPHISLGLSLDNAQLADAELLLLEELEYNLVVFSPHKSLKDFVKDCAANALAKPAFCVLSDSYWTDVGLLYPPHLIALACLYVASVLHDVDLSGWFARVHASFESVFEIARELFDVYKHDKYSIDAPQFQHLLDVLRGCSEAET